MMDIIHGHRPKEILACLEQLIKIIEHDRLSKLEGVFYLGYPLIKTPEGTRSVPALLISEKSGAIAFDVISATEDITIEDAVSKQDNIYNELEAKLKHYPAIVKKRDLAFKLDVVTFDPLNKIQEKEGDASILSTQNEVISYLLDSARTSLGTKIYESLKNVIQGVSKLKILKSRKNVSSSSTLGGLMKGLEEQIAVLDIYQNKAIVELTDSPQRITGLAGTGKTVVIAGKAAYLHAIYPDLEIAVTFYSKSLYQQYITLINRLYFNHTQDEPNWKKINLMHAWGGGSAPGLYYKIAMENGCSPLRYQNAKDTFGFKKAWAGACDKLLEDLKKEKEVAEIYDVILIDEAQDMPRSFFEICHLATRTPKRVVWAYDELQQLNEERTLPGPEVLFGKGVDGTPRFSFSESEDGPDDDIILKVCYRNPKEVLTTAHALGLGVYNPSGPFQMYSDADLWNRIGYKVTGQLKPNNNVALEREADASPKFLKEYLGGTSIIQLMKCDDTDEQAKWVAEQIQKNLNEDELQASDILVIYMGPAWDLLNQTSTLRIILEGSEVRTHIAGEGSGNQYFKEGSIAISQIYRAKGNEAPMVYILNAESCAAGTELITKRNSLFTAITRARGWVRICGVGTNMDIIEDEVNMVKENNNQLRFQFPENLEKQRKLHGELSNRAKTKRDNEINKLKSVLRSVKEGSLQLDDLPPSLQEQLQNIVNKKS